MTAIETRQGALWWGKQTAKGTPLANASMFRRGRHVAGDVNVARDDANENYTDGERFNNAADFVNTLIGNGNPTLQAQAGVVGHLAYLFLGGETVTGSADPWTHVATPNNAGSFWSTWAKKVGSSVGPLRQRFADCRMTSLRIEGSSAAKIVKVTPTFVSLDSGEVFAVDPVAVEEVGEPLLYTDGVGTFTIDGTVFKGHSSFAVQINDSVTPWYGDDVTAHDIVFGLGNIVVENVTILLDQPGLDKWNTLLYGTAAPGVGAKPLKTIAAQALGSYTFDLNRAAVGGLGIREIKVELPGVKWAIPDAPPLNPDGGAAEMALGAEARRNASNPMIKITTKSADAAYT